MRHFAGLEDAVARSQEIAERRADRSGAGQAALSHVTRCPRRKRRTIILRELCMQGLKERYAGDPDKCAAMAQLSDVVMQRLDRELDVINKLGFPNYFLIVWDFVRYARDRRIFRPRRAAAASERIVCYALVPESRLPDSITTCCSSGSWTKAAAKRPISTSTSARNAAAKSFATSRKNTAKPTSPRSARLARWRREPRSRTSAERSGLPLARVNQITRHGSRRARHHARRCAGKERGSEEAYQADPEVHELLDFARKIEGLARNVGTHAAAVVIADQPLTEYVPLGRVSGKSDIITQWAMGDVEAAGLLKMDFLGLRNLTILVEGRGSDRAIDRRARRSAEVPARRSSRRSSCCGAAKRKAFSSWKVAAFATCCSG